MTTSMPLIDAEGVDSPSMTQLGVALMTFSAGGQEVHLQGLTITWSRQFALRAEEYPVLAEIWGTDADDDIFADQPAV